MTDTGFTPDPNAIPDPDAISPDKVVVVAFADDDKAYEALATVKQLDGEGRIDLVEAAVVTRDQDGRVHVKDEAGDHSLVGTASGGLIGVLIGILGGPLGVLLGGATGLLLGSLYDLDDADTTESALGEVSKSVQVGRNSLLAQVVEQIPEVLDAADGTTGRHRRAPPGLRDRGRDRPCAGGPARRHEAGEREAARGPSREDAGAGSREGRGAEVQAPPRPQARDDRLVAPCAPTPARRHSPPGRPHSTPQLPAGSASPATCRRPVGQLDHDGDTLRDTGNVDDARLQRA